MADLRNPNLSDFPLRFEINDWRQLSRAKSNRSRELYIEVTEFIQSQILTGLRISVISKTYGCLFAYVINARGTLIDYVDSIERKIILAELRRYGFNIEISEYFKLPTEQMEFLKGLASLGFTHVRRLNVRHSPPTKFVAFDCNKRPRMLEDKYAPTVSEYLLDLSSGVLCISQQNEFKQWDWTWLDYIAHIDSLINHGGENNVYPDST